MIWGLIGFASLAIALGVVLLAMRFDVETASENQSTVDLAGYPVGAPQRDPRRRSRGSNPKAESSEIVKRPRRRLTTPEEFEAETVSDDAAA
jgi:hypothetical protein